MKTIKIKPLSVNECWRGQRFKTPKYKQYERDLGLLLPKLKSPKGKIQLFLEIGLSSKNADIDNPVKPFLDILQSKYGFNDKQIYGIELSKKDVKKGKEYITFEMYDY